MALEGLLAYSKRFEWTERSYYGEPHNKNVGSEKRNHAWEPWINYPSYNEMFMLTGGDMVEKTGKKETGLCRTFWCKVRASWIFSRKRERGKVERKEGRAGEKEGGRKQGREGGKEETREKRDKRT